MTSKVIFLTNTAAGLTWTVPADWTNVNTIECIGAGGGSSNSPGGGGGAYAKISNIILTPGASVSYQVGAGGVPAATSGLGAAGGDTWFSSGLTVLAKGGAGSTGGGSTPGGSAASSVGSVTYGGGSGLYGGGGAAGPNGAGQNGGNTAGSYNGGAGDAGFGGAGGIGGGTTSNPGGAGAEWTSNPGGTTAGAGGGGSVIGSSASSGGVGGQYGGGAGYGNGAGVAAGGNGLIVITYTPQTAFIMGVTKGTFTETGKTSTFKAAMSEAKGTFTEVGFASQVGLHWAVTAFTETGHAATLFPVRTFPVTRATFTETGKTVHFYTILNAPPARYDYGGLSRWQVAPGVFGLGRVAVWTPSLTPRSKRWSA